MTADRGREAVYAAEIAAFDGTSYEAPTTLDELLRLSEAVFEATWWPRGRVRVVAARADACSSSTRQRGDATPVVRLAAPQLTPATLVHELAHVLAGVGAGHGPVFRRAQVDLARFVFGDAEAGWLLDSYRAMGLRPGRRAWPDPPLHNRAVRGPLAL